MKDGKNTFSVKPYDESDQKFDLEIFLGGDWEGAGKLWTPEACYDRFAQAVLIDLAGKIRRAACKMEKLPEKGGQGRQITASEVQAIMDSYEVVTVSERIADKVGKVGKQVRTMTAEELAATKAMIADIEAAVADLKADPAHVPGQAIPGAEAKQESLVAKANTRNFLKAEKAKEAK